MDFGKENGGWYFGNGNFTFLAGSIFGKNGRANFGTNRILPNRNKNMRFGFGLGGRNIAGSEILGYASERAHLQLSFA